MGDAKRRKQMLITSGSKCIFCGGQADAITEEHCPPRALFKERHWPEGFAFPSCEQCNAGTSNDDLLITFMASMQPDPGPALVKRFGGLMLNVNSQFPGLLQRMMVRSPIEARKMARAVGIAPSPGQTYQDLPMVRVPEAVHDAVAVVAAKLTKAIYFIHQRKVFPADGEIAVSWFTNADLLKHGKIAALDAFKDIASTSEPITRNRKDLSDQFDYEYSTGDDFHLVKTVFGKVFGFVAVAHPSAGKMSEVIARMRETTGRSPGPFRLVQPLEPR